MMTMVATPDPKPAVRLLRRRSLRCLLGRHEPRSNWLRQHGSPWHTVGKSCRRCMKVLSVHVEKR